MQNFARHIKKLSPSKWQNVQVGKNYYVSFEILDSKILHITPIGDVVNFEIHAFYRKRAEFIEEYFGASGKYAELKNYGLVKGLPSKTVRDIQTKYFLEDKRCLGFCGYNLNLLLRSLMRLGIRVHKATYPISLMSSFGEALDFVESILKSHSVDKGWECKNEKTGFIARYSIMPGNMLLLKLIGSASEEDNEPSREVLKQIFRDKHIKGPKYIRIADYTEFKGGSLKSRKRYIEVLNSIHAEFGIYPQLTYVIGANNILKAAIIFARRFFDFNFYFVNSLEDALQDLNPEEKKEHFQKITQNDVDNLVEHIGSIAWNQEYTEFQVPEGHSLMLVYDAIALVKNDFDNLLKEQKQKEKEINEAKDIADRANSFKNEFLASITHEIRTPINTILGFSSLLKQKAKTDKEVKHLDFIMESGSSLLNLLNDLLDLSKLESNLITVSTSMCNILDIIGELIRLYNPTIGAKNLTISLQAESSFPRNLLIDVPRFRQIMLNLLGNAVKFTYKGEIKITCEFSQRSENAGELIVSVRDSGIGMKPEEVNKLFLEFSDNNSGELGGISSGLGLTLTKRLVELLGGFISVTSIEGEGSTFTISLQNVKVVNEWYRGGKVSALLHDKLQTLLSNCSIAVVEVGETITEYLQKSLSDYTKKIETLKISKTTPLKFDSMHPEVIFFYLNIPIMDAFALIKEIKSAKELVSVPIIAVSDNLAKDTDKALNFLGCNEIIAMPISYEAIVKAMESVQQKKLPNEI